MSEKYYLASAYIYCLNNPFNRVDPTGMVSRYNWETHRYEDEDGNEVSWESVKQEYGIDDGHNDDDPPSSRDDVDGVTGTTPIIFNYNNYKGTKEIYVLRNELIT